MKKPVKKTPQNRNQHVSKSRYLRNIRKVHRITAVVFSAFLIVISVSGLFLGWKKNSSGLILPSTCQGTSTQLSEWLPLDSLQQIAVQTFSDSLGFEAKDTAISRIDVRPQKGVVKFLFSKHHYGIQIDGATGKPLQVARRHSDWLENLHDGSIIGQWFSIPNGWFKLVYTTLSAFSLLLLSITGWQLWYRQNDLKRKQKKRNNN